LADYREHYPEIRSAGASLVAVSVDSCESSEALRTQLSLPFPILCDTERRVVKDWDIYNSRERGGIAKPAVFVIDPNQVVRYAMPWESVFAFKGCLSWILSSSGTHIPFTGCPVSASRTFTEMD
jgi:peroxiredoxin